MITKVLIILLTPIIFLTLAYTIRHYCFGISRLFGTQRHSYTDIDTATWPTVTVFVAAHNEEAVIADSLAALVEVDYPSDRITIMPVNDRSTDRTREIVDGFVEQYPGRIVPFHRTSGKPGKAAALKDATNLVTTDVIVVFDADYIPGRGLVKQLIAPFFDPEVGATMGRVVPQNVGKNLLTRLLDLERSGGYQVDQQARVNLGLVPQYGGTVGGVRMAALRDIGGWSDDVLAEDTDLTYRLLLGQWKTVYQNRSECYEEVPETWPVRIRQIMRWAKGHNQALTRHFWRAGLIKGMGLGERIDALALLGIYIFSPLLLLGWALSVALFYSGALPIASASFALIALLGFSAVGNFAAFFEIAVAVHLDQTGERIRLLPLSCVGFLVSTISISRATLSQMTDALLKRDLHWDKTPRFRKGESTCGP